MTRTRRGRSDVQRGSRESPTSRHGAGDSVGGARKDHRPEEKVWNASRAGIRMILFTARRPYGA